MSLLTELESRGVTAEDLEKAASVRLFEKAAAAEDVDLDSLDENQVEDLYVTFLSNQSNDDYTKEASAMNDEIVDLFEKTAASEGIDLDDMADHELAELYNHYVENVLPEQVEEYEKGASGDEEYEKLAEAEILGRHMARAYMDEMDGDFDKIARAKWKTQMGLSGGKGVGSGKGREGRAAGMKKKQQAEAAKYIEQKAIRGRRGIRGLGGKSRAELNAAVKNLTAGDKLRMAGQRYGDRATQLVKNNPRTAAGLALGGAAALGAGGAYGVSRMRDKAASVESDATLLAAEMLKNESGYDYDDLVEDRALEILGHYDLL